MAGGCPGSSPGTCLFYTLIARELAGRLNSWEAYCGEK